MWCSCMFIHFCVCICVRRYLHMPGTHVHICAYACVGQRSTSDVFLSYSPSDILKFTQNTIAWLPSFTFLQPTHVNRSAVGHCHYCTFRGVLQGLILLWFRGILVGWDYLLLSPFGILHSIFWYYESKSTRRILSGQIQLESSEFFVQNTLSPDFLRQGMTMNWDLTYLLD